MQCNWKEAWCAAFCLLEACEQQAHSSQTQRILTYPTAKENLILKLNSWKQTWSGNCAASEEVQLNRSLLNVYFEGYQSLIAFSHSCLLQLINKALLIPWELHGLTAVHHSDQFVWRLKLESTYFIICLSCLFFHGTF